MKTIIVPTDFSRTAVNALDYALGMAKEINASIILLHAYLVPVSITTDTPIVVVAEEDMRKSAEGHLRKLKMEAEEKTAGAVKIYSELKLGDTIDEIEELCTAVKPFAVIMGSGGHSDLEKTLFGSTTLKAIRHLTWPVIAVPPNKKYGGIKKIGFACDFKKVVESTPSGLIKDVVKSFNAEFHILNVDYKNKNFKPDTPQQSLLIDTLFEELHPAYDFIENEDMEQGINNFAEKNNLDLIITVPKKHKLLEGFFKKSSTKQLIYHSHIPVMSLHN